MKFYFKNEKDGLHLYEKKTFSGEDLGRLVETSNGKLKTKNTFKTNYELEDISGLFKKEKKYSIKSSKGMSGVMEKERFSDYYELKF